MEDPLADMSYGDEWENFLPFRDLARQCAGESGTRLSDAEASDICVTDYSGDAGASGRMLADDAHIPAESISRGAETSKPARKPRTKRSDFYVRGSMIPIDVVGKIRRVGIIPYCIAAPSETLSSPSWLGKRSPLGDNWRRERFSDFFPPASDRVFMQGSTVTLKPSSEDEIASAAQESTLWFALGVDAHYGELTDCGGRRKNKAYEAVETAAARELHEESACIFEMIYDTDIVRDSPAIVGEDTCVFFVRVTPRGFGFPDRLATIFAGLRAHIVSRSGTGASALQRTASLIENSLMYWLPMPDFVQIVKTRAQRGSRTPTVSSCGSASHHSDVSAEEIFSALSAAKAKAVKAVPTSIKASHVGLPGWMTKTISALSELTAPLDKPRDGRSNARHPLMYETLRRIIAPVVDEMTDALVYDASSSPSP